MTDSYKVFDSHCDRSVRDQRAPEDAMALSLNEGSFILEDGQRLFQSADFRLAPSLALCVSLWLSNTPFPNLAVVLENSAELCVGSLTVGRVLCGCCILGCSFLCSIVHVLIFECLGHGILLSHLLVLGLSVCLLRLFFGKIGGKIGFDDFQNVDDGAPSPC